MPPPDDSNSLLALISGGFTALGAVLGLGVGWGKVNSRLDEHEKKLVAHGKKHDSHYKSDEDMRKDITEIKVDVAVTREAVLWLKEREENRDR